MPAATVNIAAVRTQASHLGTPPPHASMGKIYTERTAHYEQLLLLQLRLFGLQGPKLAEQLVLVCDAQVHSSPVQRKLHALDLFTDQRGLRRRLLIRRFFMGLVISCMF